MTPVRATLDGGREHWQWGPIDLVIGADGEPAAVAAAHARAWRRFASVLPELVAELPLLRSATRAGRRFAGPVAARMQAACEPMLPLFVTPMAAVAGAVADEIVEYYRSEGIERACVNNGGDIALHLAPGRRFRVGMLADIDAAVLRAPARPDGSLEIDASMPVRGVATSGWRGRSLSLGIADSVTVLAASAAAADAAATLLANAVDVDHPAIERVPANRVRDDSDLGDRPVTVAVGTLDAAAVARALYAGECAARRMQASGLIHGAALWLAGACRIVLPETDALESGAARARASETLRRGAAEEQWLN